MLLVVTWWNLLDFRLPEEVERSRGVLTANEKKSG